MKKIVKFEFSIYDSDQFGRFAEQLKVDVVGYELGSVLPVHQLAVRQHGPADCRAYELLVHISVTSREFGLHTPVKFYPDPLTSAGIIRKKPILRF